MEAWCVVFPQGLSLVACDGAVVSHAVGMHEGTRELGSYGEDIATEFLVSRGAQLLARNWRARPSVHGVSGELDAVFLIDSIVVGVEVKTRSCSGFGHPLEAITPEKLRRLHVLLAAWVQAHGYGRYQRRVDAVSVVVRTTTQGGVTVSIEHRPALV